MQTMSKRILVILSLLAILNTSCEKRLFKFVLDLNEMKTFSIDHTGPFEIGRVVSREDVLAAADISKEANITDVRIQTIAISVTMREGNQADYLKLTAAVNDLGSGKEQIFKDYSVQLTGKLGIQNPFSPVSFLLDRGINKIKSKISGYLERDDPFDYELILSGDSDPAGERIAADVRLKIVAVVEYEECIDVLAVTAGGEECPDSNNAVGP
jgi:hypothetical protein